jgi:CheY-like chemotaxis protein
MRADRLPDGAEVAEQTGLLARPPCTILVVDDDPNMREFATEILGERSYAVLTAAICGYALRLISKQPIDILFTDIIMPGMSGFELAQQAKLIRPSLRVLYATGYVRAGEGHDTRTLGPMLGKPYRADQLLSAIDSLLANA